MHSFYDFQLSHPYSQRPLSIPFGSTGGIWEPTRLVTAQRLIQAYQYTQALPSTQLKEISDTDLWTDIVRKNLAPLIDCLERQDAENLSRLLTNFGGEYLWFGGISTGLDGFSQKNLSLEQIAFSYWDQLINLAEALGVLCVENPEQGEHGNWGQNVNVNAQELVNAMEHRLGIHIVPPTGVIPVIGIAASGRYLHYRHINALYLASRINDLISRGSSVVEYGGGLGLVAYYSRLLGHLNYTIFDLPVINVISGWFLIGTLGQNAVTLEGEVNQVNTIKIAANWNCVDLADKSVDISVNQDSFPEINRTIFDAYVHQIERTTSGSLLSINHEVTHTKGAYQHLNVSQSFSKRKNLMRVYRSPYWVRKGYVEELYRVRD